jgi:hypothetical protein
MPQPPFHLVPGLPNFRDACAGYPIADQPGKVVKAGLIYRSSEPSRITEDGLHMIKTLAITHAYDLRSAVEIQRDAQAGEGRQIRQMDGVERIFVPVFLDQDYGPEAIALRYKNYTSEKVEV